LLPKIVKFLVEIAQKADKQAGKTKDLTVI